jgi:hypothetical protein
MAAQRPPATQPLLMGDDRQTDKSWAAFFDAVARQMRDQEAEIAALKARLTAAGIP